MISRYQGDPSLTLGPNGASLTYRNGQPVMDQGLENCALLSLFTDEGWCGNIFLEATEQIGSDFEALAEGPLTLSLLADIEDAAQRALESPALKGAVATATNPTSDRIELAVQVAAPAGILRFSRDGLLWQGQAAKGMQ